MGRVKKIKVARREYERGGVRGQTVTVFYEGI
jgi:hypothetical protein